MPVGAGTVSCYLRGSRGGHRPLTANDGFSTVDGRRGRGALGPVCAGRQGIRYRRRTCGMFYPGRAEFTYEGRIYTRQTAPGSVAVTSRDRRYQLNPPVVGPTDVGPGQSPPVERRHRRTPRDAPLLLCSSTATSSGCHGGYTRPTVRPGRHRQAAGCRRPRSLPRTAGTRPEPAAAARPRWRRRSRR